MKKSSMGWYLRRPVDVSQTISETKIPRSEKRDAIRRLKLRLDFRCEKVNSHKCCVFCVSAKEQWILHSRLSS